jgi:transglutaminase-like putative cysteine protease
MRFRIRHATHYRYDQPVAIGPHVFRMQPRVDACLRLDSHRLLLYPQPVESHSFMDAEGNSVTTATFEGNTQEFRVVMESEGETAHRFLPVLDARGARFPIDYTAHGYEEAAMQAWLRTDALGGDVPLFAAAVAEASGPETLNFLDALTKRMQATLRDVSRLTGDPLDAETTLREGQGSCRDFAVLFVACCRRQGIAARFVSGYLPAAPGERQHMHAWAEALLPGAGWFPYDPTRGVVAGEEHIPVAAAAESQGATPLAGGFNGFARSEMRVELTVETGSSVESMLRG